MQRIRRVDRDRVLPSLAAGARRDGERGCRGARSAGDVGHVTVVAGRDHRQHAILVQRVHRDVLRIVGRAEAAAQRHGDDIDAVGRIGGLDVVLRHPVEGVHHQTGGAAVVAEHLQRVDAGLGSRAGAHLPAGDVLRAELRIVAALERRSVAGDAIAGGGAGDMGSVVPAGAVDRIAVRLGGGIPAIRVVVRAGEIIAALELALVQKLAQRAVGQRVRGRRQCRLVGRFGARSAEVGVGVVQSGIHDGDVHAFAGGSRLVPRLQRVDQRIAVNVGRSLPGAWLRRLWELRLLLGRVGGGRGRRGTRMDLGDADHGGVALGKRAQGVGIGGDRGARQNVRRRVQRLRVAVQGLQLGEHALRGVLRLACRRMRRAT